MHLGECGMVYRFGIDSVCDGIKILEHTFAKEGGNGRHQARQRLQAGIKSLVGRNLVGGHVAFPETAAAQTYIPVAQVGVDKFLYCASGLGGLIVGKSLVDCFHQRVQFTENPTVNFRPFGYGEVGFLVLETIDIGIQGKETVGVVKGAEQFAAHLVNSFHVKFKVVPRLAVGNHIPAGGIRTLFLQGLEGVNAIAQTFRHLVAVLVKHKTIADNVLESHAVEAHGGNGMEGVKPTARLVNAFGNKVCRELAFLQRLTHVVDLSVRHGATVKPYVNKVGFAHHAAAGGRHQHHIVDIGAVEVEFLLTVGVVLHKPGCNGLVNLIAQLIYAADANLFFAIFGAPDGQRGAPVAAAAQVPVHDILQPVAETACTGGFGFPVDGLVQLYHAVAHGRGTDKPTV